MKNRIIPYNSELKEYARYLRNNSTLSEVLLWNKIKKKALGFEFKKHPPVPLASPIALQFKGGNRVIFIV